MEKKHGRRETMLTILNSLSHELQHDYQWINDEELVEDGVNEGAKELTWEYIEDRFEQFWSSLDC